MKSKVGRTFAFLAVTLGALPVAKALDFDREIERQEKAVTVKMRQAPKSYASFLKMYPECQAFMGRERFRCNIAEAKKRYQAYNEQQQVRRVAEVSVDEGEMSVRLEPKSVKPVVR